MLYVLSEFLHHATDTPLSSPDTTPNQGEMVTNTAS